MKRLSNLVMVLTVSSLLCGCAALDPAIIWIDDIFTAVTKDTDDRDGNYPPQTTTTTSTTTTTTIPPAVAGDAIPWSSIKWHGQNKADKAVPTKELRSVTIYGDNRVMLDYDTNADWPECKVIPGCRSSFMVFTEIDGVMQGGHVDHMRLNAKQRDLGNFYSDYLMPNVPRNKDLYVAIASHDGKYRSFVTKAVRK